MKGREVNKVYWCSGWLEPPPADGDLVEWADSASETPSSDTEVLFHDGHYTLAQILSRFADGSRK